MILRYVAQERCWASGPTSCHHLVILPKVETEAPGLARSHREQGQMPEHMQMSQFKMVTYSYDEDLQELCPACGDKVSGRVPFWSPYL